MSDGSLVFDTKIDQSGFSRDAADLKNMASKVVAGIGLTISAGAIAQGLVSVGKQSVSTASDLQEVQNVVDVTFGDGAELIESWAASAASSFGMSELAAKQYTGTMGAMLKSMGLADDAVLTMSTDLAGLAGDFASFYNITSDEAFQKIRAGISGETEPLKQLGINMSVANLEAYALAEGIETAYTAMSQAEQAQLRFNYLMSVSADAQGDFARTTDSYANASRVTEMNLERIASAVGDELLPAATRFQNKLGEMAGELADAVDTGGLRAGVEYIADEFPVATSAVKGLAAAYATLAVIKTVQRLTTGYTAALKVTTAWLEAGTAMEVANAGVLTAKQALVGVLSGKMSVLTGAQALYNATLAANPIMAAVLAVGALVGGTSLLTDALEKSNPEIVAAAENASELRNTVEDLAETIETSAESYSDTIGGIESNASAAGGLITRLGELSAAYTGTKIEQQTMSEICSTLNDSVDGLNIAFDEQTGALSMTTTEMRKYVEQAAAQARTSAAIERYIELLGEQAEAEYLLAEARKAVEANMPNNLNTYGGLEAIQQGDLWRELSTSMTEAEQSYATVTEAVAEQEGYLAFLGITMTDTTTAVEDNTAAVEANAEAQKRVVIAGYDVTDCLAVVGINADDAAERLNTYTDAATNMFERINTESELSVSEMIANLQANAAAMEDFSANMALLAGQIPQALYDALAADPAEMAAVAAALAAASEEQLAALSAAYEAGGDAAVNAWLTSLGVGIAEADINPAEQTAAAIAADTSVEEAGAEVITRTQEAMSLAVENANFEAVGQGIAAELLGGLAELPTDMWWSGVWTMQGYIGGMEAMRAAVIATAESIAYAAANAFDNALEINSPSKRGFRSGAFYPEGIAGGMLSKLGLVRSAGTALADAAEDGFSDGYYPTGTMQIQESLSGGAAVGGGTHTTVNQYINAAKQSPSEMLREARWLQERAVMMGV